MILLALSAQQVAHLAERCEDPDLRGQLMQRLQAELSLPSPCPRAVWFEEYGNDLEPRVMAYFSDEDATAAFDAFYRLAQGDAVNPPRTWPTVRAIDAIRRIAATEGKLTRAEAVDLASSALKELGAA